MYRKRNGSLSFSFSRFMSNAVPNFASSWEPGSIYITRHRQDMMYSYQTGKPWPDVLDLDEKSFYWAGVCDRERQSERIFIALLRNGVLVDRGPRQRRGSTADVKATAAEPGPTTNGSTTSTSEQNTGTRDTTSTTTPNATPLSMDMSGISIDTSKIGPKFIHQLAFISQTSQKNLINVLFFWEEEFHRLRKLAAEEAELTTLISQAQQRLSVSTSAEAPHQQGSSNPEPPNDTDENGDDDDDGDSDGRDSRSRKEELDQLRFARERVRMKERQLPSQRDPKIEADTDTVLARAFTLPDPTTQANALGGERRQLEQTQTLQRPRVREGEQEQRDGRGEAPPEYWT